MMWLVEVIIFLFYYKILKVVKFVIIYFFRDNILPFKQYELRQIYQRKGGLGINLSIAKVIIFFLFYIFMQNFCFFKNIVFC